MLILKVMEPK